MSNTDQPQPPRTCGGCKWFRAYSDGDYGDCEAPIPMVYQESGDTRKDYDATRCPCFTAKEAQ